MASLERRAGNLPLAMEHINRAIALSAKHTPSLQEKALILMAQVTTVSHSDVLLHS